MKKLKVVVEVSDSDFEVLKSGDPADFEESCDLIVSLQECVRSGNCEVLE